MWLNPLLDSGNGFDYPPISIFADVERSQCQNVWNDFDYAKLSDLWNLNAFRRLKKEEFPKNANVVTGKLVRI